MSDGFENRANHYRVKLPKDLAEPVRVSAGQAWIEYALEGAAATGAVDGEEARYRGAFSGVDVSYAVRPDAVKEEITLAGPQSKRSFRFALRTSPGLSARSAGRGGIEIVDRDGDAKFSFAPPVMWDSAAKRATSGSIAVRLSPAGAGYVIELEPDRGWLEDSRRQWPVVLDPTVTLFPPADCHIAGGDGGQYENYTYCASSPLNVGRNEIQECDPSGGCSVSTPSHRALLKFDLAGVIPSDAAVSQASLAIYKQAGGPATVDSHALTRPWTNPTWRSYNGSNLWTSPGGDFEPTKSASATIGTAPNYSYWDLTGLVGRWVGGETPNHGVLLKSSSEGQLDAVEFASVESLTRPHLVVWWQRGAGDYPQATFSQHRLTDRSAAGVNVSNGNLLVRNSDLQIAGTGLDLNITRAYNTFGNASDALGQGWNIGVGGDVRVFDNGSAHVVLYDASGASFRFLRNTDGTFQTPLGLRATLTRVSPTSLVLTQTQTGEKYTFTSAGPQTWGRLTSRTDKYNNTIRFSYSGGRLASITDTQGRVVTAEHDAAGHLRKLTDPTGRAVQYTHDAQGRLTSYTDAGSKQTVYSYDGAGRLDSITTPAGRVTRIGYDAQGRVETIIRTTDAAHTTGPTTTFAYSTGSPCAAGETKTVVSDPLAATAAGHTITYCSDIRERVTRTVDSAGNATTKTYATTGDLASIKQPGGGVTNLGYDPATRNLLCIQRGATSVQACQTATGGLKTTFVYGNTDALTKFFPTRLTNPQNKSIVLCYNGSTPACGTQSGPAGSVQSVTNGLASQSVRRFTYNAKGNPTSSTDARGYVTAYGYDSQGNDLTSITPPAGAGLGAWAISPDALSRPGVITDGKGQTATYSYDPLDRVTGTTYAPGGPTFGATYDNDGPQKTLTDPAGTTTYTTDDLLRLTRENFPDGTSNAYDYDPASNLKSITDPGGTTTYAHNGLNQLSSVTEPGDQTATTFTYNPDGARTQIRYPSGVTVNTGYHLPTGRVTSVSNKAPNGTTVLRSFAYNYTLGTADTELPQKVTDQANNVTTNTYDALDRLTSAVTTGPNPSRFAYSLDGNGNRLSITYNRNGSTGGTTETYAYDNASLPCWRALGAIPSTCGSPQSSSVVYYTHDANGSDLWNTRQQYTYNTASQPTSVYVSATATTASLAYRGDGQAQLTRDGSYAVQTNQLGIGARASGSTAAASSTSSTTSSSPTASSEDERSASPEGLAAKPPPPSSGSPCENSTSGAFSPLAAAATATSYYARATDGTAISQRTPSTSQRRNYLYDGDGSVVGLTDGSGALQTSYKYEPYGHPANFTSLGDPNPFGYLGTYTAGVETAGVICGGPNASGDGFYDAEDGRYIQTPFGPAMPTRLGAGDVLGPIAGGLEGAGAASLIAAQRLRRQAHAGHPGRRARARANKAAANRAARYFGQAAKPLPFVGPALDTTLNMAEGRGTAESLIRGALSGVGAGLGGGVAAAACGVETFGLAAAACGAAGGASGAVAGDKVGDFVFGE